MSKTGEQERADLLLDRSLQYIQTLPRLGLYGYRIADVQIYALQGEKQKALSALRQAIDEGWRFFWWYYLKYNPNLESLHDEPEYQAMVAEIEADMAAQLARVREMERKRGAGTDPRTGGGLADVTDRRTQASQRLPSRRGLRDRGLAAHRSGLGALPTFKAAGMGDAGWLLAFS